MQTILDEDIQRLFDKQGGVENDQTKAEGQNIVACPDFQEGTDGSLRGGQHQSPKYTA